MHTTIYFKLKCKFLGDISFYIFQQYFLEVATFFKEMGGLEYRNKGGDNYNCAYATPVNFHVFMKYVAPTKFTHKSA